MLEVLPLSSALAAEVRGVDLKKTLSDGVWRQIESAFHTHAVLIFPRQDLTDDEQIAFSKRFGRLERFITRVKNPEIAPLSNVDHKGKVFEPDSDRAYYLKGNSHWHTDSSYKPVPAKASLLSARVLPSSGGETEYADMRAAWDVLDDEGKNKLNGLEAVHDHFYSQSLVGGTTALSNEEWAAMPPVVHRVVRTHPATGRRNLYIGRHASHILGRDVDESRAFLQELCEQACQPARTYLHDWSVGDLVAWDNRCVLHRGRPWDPSEPRIMHRTTVAGDGPNEWAL